MKRARPKTTTKPVRSKTTAAKTKLQSRTKPQSKTGYTYDDIDVPEMIRAKKSQTVAPRGKKKKKKNKKVNAGTVILLIIFGIIAVFMFMMGRSLSGGEAEGALIPVDMDKGKLNVLMLGVDEDGLRTDALMLVSYDLTQSSAKVLSIPRDTQIKVTDRGVTRKINEIHAMSGGDGKIAGALASIKAVTALTSVPIHYYIELNFDGIDELADAVGPIEFDVPDIEGNGRGMNYDDPAQGLSIHLKPGLQKLRGNEVQQFLRYRKSNNGTGDGSDTKRVERQQEFLKAAIDQKVNVGLIAKVPNIYKKLKKYMKTNFSLADAIKYAKYLKNFSGDKVTSFSLPGEAKLRGAWYFFCDFDETAQLIRNEFSYDAMNITNKITLNDVQKTSKPLSSDKKEPAVSEQETDKEPEEEPQIQESEKEDNTENEIIDEDNIEQTPSDDYEDLPNLDENGYEIDEGVQEPEQPVDDTDFEDDVITLE